MKKLLLTFCLFAARLFAVEYEIGVTGEFGSSSTITLNTGTTGTQNAVFDWTVGGTSVGASNGSASATSIRRPYTSGTLAGGYDILYEVSSDTQLFLSNPLTGTQNVTLTNGTEYAIIISSTYKGGSEAYAWRHDEIKYFVAGSGPPMVKLIKVQHTNSKEIDIKVWIVNNAGTMVWDSGVLAPGQSVNHTEDVTARTDGPFDIVFLFRAANTDGIWEVRPWEEATQVTAAENIDPEPIPEGEDPEPTPMEEPTGEDIPAGGITTRTTIWRAPTDATTDANRLDKATYKQGVDKLEEAIRDGTSEVTDKLDAVVDAIGDIPGSGGGGGATGTEVADSMADKATTDLTTAQNAASESVESGSTMLEAEKDAALAGIPTLGAPTITPPEALDSEFWSVHHGGSAPGNFTLNFDPTATEKGAAMFNFGRALMAWCIIVFYMRALLENTRDAVQGIGFAKTTEAGMTSVLGTGTSVPTALVKAALALGAAFLVIPAVYFIFSEDVGVYNILTTFMTAGTDHAVAATGGQNFVIQGVALLDKIMPVVLASGCIIGAIVHRMICQSVLTAFYFFMRGVSG